MMTNNYKPFIGGVPVSIERLAAELRCLGHEVYIFAPSYEGEEKEEYVIRYHSLKHKARGEYIIPNVLDPVIEKTFASLPFDLIHVHHPMLIGYVAKYLGRKYNVPVILTYHTRYEHYLHYLKLFGKRGTSAAMRSPEPASQGRRLLTTGAAKVVTAHNRWFINGCDLVFAPSASMKEYLLEQGIVTDMEVIPTGLQKEEFEYDPIEADRLRRQYAKDSPYLFCSVSRLEKEKNIEFLLKGLKCFKERKGDCFKMLLIGEGGLRPVLEKLTAELGLESNIIFCGSIPHKQLRNYYHACDAFLFASTSETQGIVLLEAMAAGLPVVAVRASGVRDVIVDGQNGYCTEEEIEAWTAKLIKLSENEAIAGAMGRKAKEDALGYLSARIAKAVQKCYQNVLYRRRMEPEYEYQNNYPVASRIISLVPEIDIADRYFGIKSPGKSEK